MRRPRDAARFNGTVVLFWNNVSLGFDLLAGESPEIYDGGFAFVGVSTQRNGVHGYPGGASPGSPSGIQNAMGRSSFPATARPTTSSRKRRRRSDVTAREARTIPSDGLPVRHVIALGASQSANWLATYLNAVQPLTRALDGFILDIYFGNGSPLEVLGVDREPPRDTKGDSRRRHEDAARIAPAARRSRRAGVRAQQRDRGDRLLPGSSARLRSVPPLGSRGARAWLAATAAPTACRRTGHATSAPKRARWARRADANILSMEPVRSAALHHFQRWLTDGIAPPRQPPIVFDVEERGPVIRRDHLGIAVGGVRLPDVDVPTACHRGVARTGHSCSPARRRRSPTEMLRALYPTGDAYRARYTQAAAAAVAAGVLLPDDADADWLPRSTRRTAGALG